MSWHVLRQEALLDLAAGGCGVVQEGNVSGCKPPGRAALAIAALVSSAALLLDSRCSSPVGVSSLPRVSPSPQPRLRCSCRVSPGLDVICWVRLVCFRSWCVVLVGLVCRCLVRPLSCAPWALCFVVFFIHGSWRAVGTQVGLIQLISCSTAGKALQLSCHMLEGTICDLITHCGDDR